MLACTEDGFGKMKSILQENRVAQRACAGLLPEARTRALSSFSLSETAKTNIRTLSKRNAALVLRRELPACFRACGPRAQGRLCPISANLWRQRARGHNRALRPGSHHLLRNAATGTSRHAPAVRGLRDTASGKLATNLAKEKSTCPVLTSLSAGLG